MGTRRTSPRRFATTLALLPLLLAPQTVAADTEPDGQAWTQILLDGKADGLLRGLRLSLDLHVRRMNAPRAPVAGMPGVYDESPNTLVIVRPSVGYQVHDLLTLTVGYAFTPIVFDDPDVRAARDVLEHRAWEQLAGRYVHRRLELSYRTRFEQRVRTNGPGSAENDAGLTHWAHRYRQQARLAVRLREGRPYLLVVSDEVFVHLNDTNYRTETGFDQNRAFVGFAYDTPELRVELGYMNQRVRRTTDPDQANHALATNLVLKFGPRPAASAAAEPERAPEPERLPEPSTEPAP